MKIYFAFILLFAIHDSEAAESGNKCCAGNEYLIMRTKRCSDGKKPSLDCKKYIYTEKQDVTIFTVDNYGDLIIEENHETGFVIENGSYCLGNLFNQSEHVALICYEDDNALFWELRSACAILSILFFIVVLMVYFLVPTLRDLQGKCTMHAIANLTMAFTTLTALQLGRFPSLPCQVLGFNVYFSFLAAFFWLNVICFHVWRSTVRPTFSIGVKYLYWLSVAYGYGIPLIFLVSAVVSHNIPGDHLKPGIGITSCWLSGETATWAYFYIPVSFVIATNVIMFCWTAAVLWKSVGNSCRQTHRLKVLRAKCTLYAKLSVVMGLTWIFEVLSFIFKDMKGFISYVWTVFDYINILQGFFIFLVLVLFRKRAIKGIAETGLLCCKKWKEIEDNESENTDILCPNADELKELNNEQKYTKNGGEKI